MYIYIYIYIYIHMYRERNVRLDTGGGHMQVCGCKDAVFPLVEDERVVLWGRDTDWDRKEVSL